MTIYQIFESGLEEILGNNINLVYILIMIILVYALFYNLENIYLVFKKKIKYNKLVEKRRVLEGHAINAFRLKNHKLVHKKLGDIKRINEQFRHPLKNIVLIEINAIIKILFEVFKKKYDLKIKLHDLYPRISDIEIKNHTFVYSWNISPNSTKEILSGKVGKITILKENLKNYTLLTNNAAFLAALWFGYYICTKRGDFETLKNFSVKGKHNLCRVILANAGLLHLTLLHGSHTISLIKKEKETGPVTGVVLKLSDKEKEKINKELGKKRVSHKESLILSSLNELSMLNFLIDVLEKEVYIVEKEEMFENNFVLVSHPRLKQLKQDISELKIYIKYLNKVVKDKSYFENDFKSHSHQIDGIRNFRNRVVKQLSYLDDIIIRGKINESV